MIQVLQEAAWITIFFSLGMDLDIKAVTHVQTACGADMGAVGFVTLAFSINKHLFVQQFNICQQQTRPSY